MVSEKISITAEFFTKNADVIIAAMDKNKKAYHRMQSDMQKRNKVFQKQSLFAQNAISKGLSKQNDATLLANNVQKGFFGTLGMGLKDYKKSQVSIDGMTSAQKKGLPIGHRAAMGIRKATHGMRGFRMEMLGVMFFGMAMQRMFGGLLKTSLEWTGVMDLLSTALGVVFLPIALWLMEALIPIAVWFMNLSDSTKMWIGGIVILGFVLGTALMIIGQFALGIGSIILVMSAAGITVGSLVVGLLSMLATIAIIAGAIVVLKGALNGFDTEFDDSVAKWQQNGGTIAKIMGGIVRVLNLGGALFAATFLNAISLIIIAFNYMAKGLNFNITWIINKLIDAWNWIKKVAAMGGDYEVTKSMKSSSAIFDERIAAEKQKIADRSVDLILNTPTLGDLFTGGTAVPEMPVDNRTNAEKRGEVVQTNITNNYNGFTIEELKKEIDSRDRELVAEMERNR